MKIFETNISPQVADDLAIKLKDITCLEKANQVLYDAYRIVSFFENEQELIGLKSAVNEVFIALEEPDRAEYGDFQTNTNLAEKAVLFLIEKKISPQILIEPTCGKGNFIIAALSHFSNLEYVYGVEIYKPYIWETKFNIIHFLLNHVEMNKPIIYIIHQNVFDFDFKKIYQTHKNKQVLILGNPPWVTNAKLSSLNSTNVPQKNNFKKHKGLDAMTGKGNFDIAEYITLMMIESFQEMKGHIFFLVKNTVTKNIIFSQIKNNYKISEIKQLSIDSKKEFNVSVEASFLFAVLNKKTAYICEQEYFYYKKLDNQVYGWLNEKFVSQIDTYILAQEIEGISPFEWRQGIKHDCSAIMELDKMEDDYVNGLQEKISLESDLVYGILKSSDLKKAFISQTRKYTIVTQQKVGQDTAYIAQNFPQTYQYLSTNKAYFAARKSSIYLNKPNFSIFGIGEYAFKPYKVAISALYKTFHFSLVFPQNKKTIMLDDTCYFIGFDKVEFAAYTYILLNSEKTKDFLAAITFSDAKRTFTKDILMRIDLGKLANFYGKYYIQEKLNEIKEQEISLNLWDSFLSHIVPVDKQQMLLF